MLKPKQLTFQPLLIPPTHPPTINNCGHGQDLPPTNESPAVRCQISLILYYCLSTGYNIILLYLSMGSLSPPPHPIQLAINFGLTFLITRRNLELCGYPPLFNSTTKPRPPLNVICSVSSPETPWQRVCRKHPTTPLCLQR